MQPTPIDLDLDLHLEPAPVSAPPRRSLTPRLASTTLGRRYEAPPSEPSDRIRLHLNENLLGTRNELPDHLLRLAPSDLQLYPAGGASRLTHAIACAFAIEPEAVHLGLGASALLNQIFAAFANCRARALLPSPTWSYYHSVMQGCAIAWDEVPMLHQTDRFEYDVDGLVAAATRRAPDLVVLTSPNNPTGSRLSYADVIRIAKAAPEALVLLDEAYHGFAPDDPMPVAALLRRAPNVVVLRTFSKAFALAGLRVGFALAGPLGGQLLQRQPVPFGVPLFAQRIAAHRLRDPLHLSQTRDAAQAARRALAAGLADHPGFSIYRSDANFVLVQVHRQPAAAVQQALRRRGFEVKAFTGGPLDGFLRITLAHASVMADLATAMLDADATPDLSTTRGALR